MITGSIVALATPMYEDGSLDMTSLQRLVEFHIRQQTDAIVAVGTTGESATLDTDEHCLVIQKVVEYAHKRIPVIAGTGSNSTREAIELSQCALQAGATACLSVTPYYNKPTQEGLYQHFKSIAETVDIPQILYNVPGRTACDILPETVAKLAPLDNIIGIKEASGSIDRIQTLLNQCGDTFAVYSGDDAIACQAMLAGGHGVISVTANVAPLLMHQMSQFALDKHTQAALEIDQKLQGLHQQLFAESNPIPVKWALWMMGMMTSGIRLPLTILSAPYHEKVLDAMYQAGIELL